MSVTSVMVYVDFDRGCENRICAAADLASRFNALLIGVGALPLLPIAKMGFRSAEKDQQHGISERLEHLGEEFRRAAEKTTRKVEWRSSPHFPREALIAQACAADILVIGKEFILGDIYRTYDPGTVILEAGRPVLVLPDDIKLVDYSRVLIGWKDTREARRAVRDALPILKSAQNVAIAVANRQLLTPTGIDEQVADLTRYLASHKIVVDEQIETVAGEADGRILLEVAHDFKAGLIVAGAYGRTRFSEWIFGGVTRHLLKKSTIPCLFSH